MKLWQAVIRAINLMGYQVQGISFLGNLVIRHIGEIGVLGDKNKNKIQNSIGVWECRCIGAAVEVEV